MRFTSLIVLLLTVVTSVISSPYTDALKLISENKTEQGLSKLEQNFNSLPKEDKVLAANILALSPNNKLENERAYYAKYALKFDHSLAGTKKAKIIRILADHNFQQGVTKIAIEQYLQAIKLSREKTLTSYLTYKLGWAYINEESYQKTLKLWIPYVHTDNSLSSQFIHDYGKFWAEYLLKHKIYYKMTSIKEDQIQQLHEGIKNGILRYKKNLKINKALSKVKNIEDKRNLISAYLQLSSIKKCEILNYSDILNQKSIQALNKEFLKPHLSNCLADNLERTTVLKRIASFYGSLKGFHKEKFIISLKLNDHKKSCLIINKSFENESNHHSIVEMLKNKPKDCKLNESSIASLLSKTSKKNINIFLTYPQIANLYLKSTPQIIEQEKNYLIQGLIGSPKFISSYQKWEISNEKLLLLHLEKLLPKKLIEVQTLQKLASDEVQQEFELYIYAKIDKKLSNIKTKSIIKSCKSYTESSLQYLISYIITQKDTDLFFKTRDCFEINTHNPDKAFIMASLNSRFPLNDQSTLSKTNKLVFDQNYYIKDKGIVSYLKKGFPSLYLMNRTKMRLIGIGKLNKSKLDQLNTRLNYYRIKIFKTVWINEITKKNTIFFYNQFLEKKIKEIARLKLSSQDKAVIENSFSKYRIL